MTPGIHFNIPMAEYRAAEGVSISALKEMGISPRHYLSAISEPPKPPTDAQKIGTVVHSVVLEEDHSHYVIRPHGLKFTTKEGKEWRDSQTKPILDREDADNLHGMVTALKNHPMASRIIYGPGGRNEVCAWKVHERTGLLLKGRADRVTQDGQQKTVVVDLKTAQRGDASPQAFSREINNWKYHLQSQFYTQLFEASFFVFVAVEKAPPYAVACYCIDQESLQKAHEEIERHLARVKECQEKGVWPAYSDDLMTIGIPEYAKRKADL